MEGKCEVFGISGRNATNLDTVVRTFREQMVKIREELEETQDDREAMDADFK